MLPSPTACGKTVALPSHATPCSASVPVLKEAMPSRGMAGWYWCSSEIFSSSYAIERREDAA